MSGQAAKEVLSYSGAVKSVPKAEPKMEPQTPVPQPSTRTFSWKLKPGSIFIAEHFETAGNRPEETAQTTEQQLTATANAAANIVDKDGFTTCSTHSTIVIKDRKFIVLFVHYQHYVCIPLFTYNRSGCAGRPDQDDHISIYDNRVPSARNEQQSLWKPLRTAYMRPEAFRLVYRAAARTTYSVSKPKNNPIEVLGHLDAESTVRLREIFIIRNDLASTPEEKKALIEKHQDPSWTGVVTSPVPYAPASNDSKNTTTTPPHPPLTRRNTSAAALGRRDAPASAPSSLSSAAHRLPPIPAASQWETYGAGSRPRNVSRSGRDSVWLSSGNWRARGEGMGRGGGVAKVEEEEEKEEEDEKKKKQGADQQQQQQQPPPAGGAVLKRHVGRRVGRDVVNRERKGRRIARKENVVVGKKRKADDDEEEEKKKKKPKPVAVEQVGGLLRRSGRKRVKVGSYAE